MEARVEGAVERARAVSIWRRLLVGAAKALAVLYPSGLLGAALALRCVGESWWVTTVGLYLPRLTAGIPLPFVLLVLYALRLRRWLWSQLASAALVLFPLMGFVVPWPSFADRTAPTMRVLTYNINSGNGGADNVVEEIERYSPDVVLLQEVAHQDELEKLLQAHFATVDVRGQFVLATRYPLVSRSDPERLPFDGRPHNPRFVQQVLDTPLGRVAFYNVHPISPREDFGALRGQGLRREILSGRLFSGASGPLIRHNAGLRALQVETFSEAAGRETDPVVIAGDTNLPGLSQVFGRYLSSYQDAFQKAGWGFGYTYPSEPKKPQPWMRIDRILAADTLRVVGVQVGDSSVSDHRCVVADLQRR
jgi:vancomycin resistance protein VanJ